MKKILLTILWLLAILMPSVSWAQSSEPYAVLSDENTKLTFYYDDQKTTRSGMSVGPYSDVNLPEWRDNAASITTVVFDDSFASYTGLTNTSWWFDGCSNLTTITGMANLKTDNVTDMTRMFCACSSLTSIDLSNLKTDNVTTMSGMFYACGALESLDLSSFNTENLEDMHEMFTYCQSLTSINLSSFNTLSVATMAGAFDDCRSLTSLDLSSFNTSSVLDMSYMFHSCLELVTIYVGTGWNTAAVTSSTYMFTDCTKLVGGAGTVFDESYTDYTYAHIDGGTSNPGYFTRSGDEPYVATEAYAVLSSDNTTLTFYYDKKKAEREGMSVGPFSHYLYRGWNDNRTDITTVVFDESFANNTMLTSTAWWFYECSNLSSIVGMANLKTSNVTDMYRMFSFCSALTTIDVSGFDTGNVTNMSCMFADCNSVTSLDVSGFNTGKVTDMSNMFQSCYVVDALDVSSFNTSSVTTMSSMFFGCSALTSLDLSSFNTSSLETMGYMFASSSSLSTIFVGSGWSTAAVTESGNMFADCTSLVGGAGTVYDADHIDATYAHIDGGTSNPGYFTDIADYGKVNEAYAVLSSDGLTVTFYYDKQKSSRGGTDINGHVATSPYGSATTAVIDDTFANYRPTSTAYWFYGCSSLTSITGIENIKTVNVTNMMSMFWNCFALTSLDVTGFNTENVTNMENMFYGCSALTSINVSNFNTTNVTSMGSMFQNCSSLTSLDLSNFNTANVTEIACIFSRCSGLTSINVSSFNTVNVTNMGEIFYGCSSLTSLDVSSFNTANVTDMASMFWNCTSLTSLDLSNFNTANVMDMREMFASDENLATIYVSSEWTVANVTDGTNMFYGCTSLVGGMGTTYDMNNDNQSYAHIDGGTSNPGYFTRSGDEPYVATEAYAVLSSDNTTLTFYYDKQKATRNGMGIGMWGGFTLSSITTVTFDPSFAEYHPTSLFEWFYGFSSLSTINDIENLKTDNVTNMSGLFRSCSSLTSLDLSSFNTSNVTNMRSMFEGCSALSSLNLNGFDTSQVIDMGYMFMSCPLLTSLDISSFNTSNVSVMIQMFAYNTGLITLDLSNFNTSQVTVIGSMFRDCSNLTTIYVGDGWTISAVTEEVNGSEVFSGCTSLVGGAGTVYSESNSDYRYARIDGGISNPGYFTEKSNLAAGDLLTAQTTEGVTLTFRVDNPDAMTCRVAADNERPYMDTTTSGVVTIPSMVRGYSVVSIERGAFYECPNVTEFVLPNTLSIINVEAFRNCTSLTTLHIPASLTTIHTQAHPWPGCSSLTTITVDPDNPVFDSRDNCNAIMKTDENLLVVGCKGTTIPEGTVTIGHSAFDTMGELPALVIPSSVQNIVAYAFWGCSYPSVTSYIEEPFETSCVWDHLSQGCILYVPSGKVDAYKALSEWNNFQTITTIGSAEEAYAVLSTDNTTLTFYYDLNKESRGGMSVGPFSSAENRGWNDNASSITSVVFDSSFANDTTLTSTANWFSGMSNLTAIDGLQYLNTKNVTDMVYMFSNCSSLTSLDVTHFNTQNVTNMAAMFNGCSGLTSLDVTGFNTQNVTNIGYMFQNCSALTSLDVTGFNTQNVRRIDGMFASCSGLTSLDLTGFNTQNVTTMNNMFNGCSGLTSLDLSNFNTQNVTGMNWMFLGCSNLKTIYVGEGWSTAAVSSGNGMFDNCTALVGGTGTVYDAEHTDYTYAHIDGGADNPGYFTMPLSMGDANGDGSINIADAVATVTHILGETSDGNFYRYAADMNNDSVIDIFDVTLIVNAALNAPTPAPALTRGSIDYVAADAILLTSEENSICMGIDQAQQYTAFQFDIDLPEGMSLVDVKLPGMTDHRLSYVQRGANQYRVVALSMSNEMLRPTNGHVIQLQVSNTAGESNVKVSNVLFVTPFGKTVTGIGECLNTTMATDGNIYNLRGEKIGKPKQQLGKGIYIMNHKKVIIK